MRRPARILIVTALAVALLLIFGRAASELYTEVLWFRELGYGAVLWKRIAVNAAVRVVTGLAAASLILLNLWVVIRQLGPVQLRRRYGNLEIAEQVPRSYVHGGTFLASVLAGWWLSGISFGSDSTLPILAWLNRGSWGVSDPLFGRDLGFFVFSLPVYSRLLDYFLLVTLWAVLLAVIGYVLVGAVRVRGNRLEIDENPRLHFAVLVAILVLLFGARYWIGRYDILLGGGGFSGGVGYTDVHARLPARRALAMLSLVAAISLLYGALRRVWWPPVLAVGLLLLSVAGLGYMYPSIVQKLRVEPNELEREERFIRWNVEYTRRAYGLSEIQRIDYMPRSQRISGWSSLARVIEGVPLWDTEQLQTVFGQVQSRHAYYHFPSVHYDRYGAPGAKRQVAVAVREFSEQGLPPENRTWRTLHLNPQQVRGLGAVVTPAAEKAALGDPVFWLSDIDPVRKDLGAPAALELVEPSVYFGESMEGYLVLASSHDTSVLSQRLGTTPGIPLSSFTRLLAFAWRFGDKNLLFTGELTDSSRLIFRRRVSERVARIAPFVAWDRDVHPVIARGRVVWMIDGYTTSSTFPLSHTQRIGGIGQVRYLQNTVKATVDGTTGAVSFYALTDDDPILESYRRVFDGLIQPIGAMPDELVRHLRYPMSYLQLQVGVLKDYHVDSPEVFFSGQNRWEIPQEQGRPGVNSPYQPIFMMSRLPGSSQSEFLLIAPFIARDRQNMTALLIVRNDPAAYGEMVLLELPRDRQITGPRQVQSLLEQDPDISSALSLLRQKGSDVDYGRLRVVPLDSAMLYVQPIYLSAAGNSIPQLQLVIVSDGSAVNMAATLPAAIDGLYRGSTDGQPLPRDLVAVGATPQGAWPEEALQLMEEADRALRVGDWTGFGERWAQLRDLLNRAAREPLFE